MLELEAFNRAFKSLFVPRDLDSRAIIEAETEFLKGPFHQKKCVLSVLVAALRACSLHKCILTSILYPATLSFTNKAELLVLYVCIYHSHSFHFVCVLFAFIVFVKMAFICYIAPPKNNYILGNHCKSHNHI